MTIAIIADPLDNQRAGVHVYVRELVKALIENPGDHQYILIREKVDPQLPIRQVAIPNVRLPIGFASLRLFFLVPAKLRRLKVDAVFEPAHFGPFNLPSSIRRITMIHDLTPILFPQYHHFHSQLLQRLFLPAILKRADLVISNSSSTQSDLERVYPQTRGKIATIHLGVSDGFFPDSSTDFLTTYGITDPYFLYVGTIEPRKNLLQLLTAYQEFRNRHPACVKLLIVGQMGWKSEAFAQALKTHPFQSDIVLTGYIEKVLLPQAYHHALALVYPSVYEGFGFPIAEAMACGTGVICPNNSSLPEVGGNLARYYPTEDTNGLTEHLISCAREGMPTANQRARYVDWSRQFNWATYARAFNAAMTEQLSPP
jgi:glycosyltransferase involved in cell wall biosynthesis